MCWCRRAVALLAISAVMLLPDLSAATPTRSTPGVSASEIVVAGSPADLAAAVASTNGFGLDLYRALRSQATSENLFISPLSVAMALTMTAEGAAGETASQMAAVLRFPASTTERASIDSVHRGHAALIGQLRVAAGAAPPEVRAQIEQVRAQRAELEARGRSMAEAQNWTEFDRLAEAAERQNAMLAGLLTAFDRFELEIASSLWVDRSFDVLLPYVMKIDLLYGGGLTNLDIRGDTEGSRKRINDWVAKRTSGRIAEMIPKGALRPEIALVITNAIYFRGEWADPFDAERTREEPFTRADGTATPAKLMHDPARASIGYAAFTGRGEHFETPRRVPVDPAARPATYPDDGGFSMIELPYKGGALSMVVIAPRSASGLGAIESMLGPESLKSWLGRLDRRTVDVAIPRFALAWNDELSGALRGLGMSRAFVDTAVDGGAEFPGISSGDDPSKRLFIGSVLHKSWVEVTEEGTEAAAATAVSAAPGSAVEPPRDMPFTPVFRADRPFLFIIRDTASGAILFMGRMANPTA
ncbi:MAG TPA: serpin family protein [Phycisphaerales bacterium]|nr:serpin family protein [Phycisphaerales bacterium]HMP36879.1 serpin family protein [Phycisphaerales bacterium]